MSVGDTVPPRPQSSDEVLSAFVSRSWRSNAERQIGKGVNFVIGRREGAKLWNLEGTKQLIDCGTGGGVHSLGHRHPEVLAALRGALDDGHDTGLWSMPNAPYLKLQDRLAELAPHPGLDRSVITLASTTSVDVAAMFAFRFTGRQRILSYRHGYHGHSGFAALVTGSPEEGVIEHFKLPTQLSVFFERFGDLDELDGLLSPDVAALILEPMDYETFAPATAEYLEGVSRLCAARGALLIVDETRTGIGRTGRLWASEQYRTRPDMMIAGKGLSGGLYPVSALLVRREIYESCMNEHPFAYISSLGGNEISCIVANRVLDVASRPAFLDHVRHIAGALERRFRAVCAKHHNLLSPGTGFGCLQSVAVNDPAQAAGLYRAMYREGVLCHSVSTIEPTALKFCPPLILSDSEVEEIGDALDRAASSVA